MKYLKDGGFNVKIRENGKVLNSEEAISLTCAMIKKFIGLELTNEEEQKEKHIFTIIAILTKANISFRPILILQNAERKASFVTETVRLCV